MHMEIKWITAGILRGKILLPVVRKYMEKMGQYPVIILSLKSAKQPEFVMAYESLKNEIQREFRRHRYKNTIIRMLLFL